jgi:hypothetical protein
LIDHDRTSHISSTTSDNLHEQQQHHALITPFIHPSQQINTNSTNTNSTGTLTTNNNQSQASGINVSKVFSTMGSTVDRSAFRQQPPPMKVKFLSLKLFHT